LRDRAIEDGRAAGSLANLACDIESELSAGLLAHHGQGLLDALIGDEAQEWRLFELDGETLAEGAVEDRIAGRVCEVGEDDRVFGGKRRGMVRAPVVDSREDEGDDCEAQHANFAGPATLLRRGARRQYRRRWRAIYRDRASLRR
jgi:hypothetical protein